MQIFQVQYVCVILLCKHVISNRITNSYDLDQTVACQGCSFWEKQRQAKLKSRKLNLILLFCVQVRRWMRNPKVNVEKTQGKNLLYQCPRCPLAEDLWYTHYPSPYGCCHYAGLQGCHYYHQEPCSPCTKTGQPSGREKAKSCKVRDKQRVLLVSSLCCLCYNLLVM